MAKERMTKEREEKINYLYRRAYPVSQVGTRKAGSREFYAELCDQPDHILQLLYDSAKEEQEKRKTERKSEKEKVS